jgi:superfamily II RNA helicase
MERSNTLPMLTELPANSTNAEALEWVRRMRRLVDRWEELPGYKSFSMTPQLRRQAHQELDEVELGVRRNMAEPETV